MWHSRINVAAVMAVLFSFVVLGCGQPPTMMPDADSGPDVMTDAGVMPDLDSGPDPMRDAGNPGEDAGGAAVCHPSQSDPLCEMAPAGASCVCDMSFMDCETSPELCMGPAGANTCAVGGYNLCGFHLPMSMDTYRYDEWRTECDMFVMNAFWFGPGGERTVRTEWRNGQLWLLMQGGGRYICGNEGKCWQNWANADLSGEAGDHSVIELTPDCRGMREELYRGGETVPYDTVGYVFRRNF